MRLKSKIWIQSYIRILAADDIPAMIMRTGEESAGAIYIKINLLDGHAKLYTPAPSMLDMPADNRYWKAYKEDTPVLESRIDNYLEEQVKFDPDLWIIEAEDSRGRSFLGDALYEKKQASQTADMFFKKRNW